MMAPTTKRGCRIYGWARPNARQAYLVVILTLLAGSAGAQPRKPGAPEDHLPPNITQLVAFGERPAWSPDGKRIAFIGKSFGDAYEIDLNTKLVRMLTGRFRARRIPARPVPPERRLPRSSARATSRTSRRRATRTKRCG